MATRALFACLVFVPACFHATICLPTRLLNLPIIPPPFDVCLPTRLPQMIDD